MKFTIDLHTHTLASGHAYSTIHDYLTVAKEKGMDLFAVTDHGPSMEGASTEFHFMNQTVIPRSIDGVTILRGVEGNILDATGVLDLSDETLESLDFIIGSLHPITFVVGEMEYNTDALVNAMKIGHVDVIGHPGNAAVTINVDRIIKAAKDYQVALELNNATFTSPYRSGSQGIVEELVRKGVEEDIYFALGSDAHFATALGDFEHILPLLEKYQVKPERIINSSKELLLDFLKKRGKNIE